MVKILLLIVAVCTDCFVSAVGLGTAGIKIPLRSTLIISLVGTVFLGISVGFAEIIMLVIPQNVCSVISSALLVALGLFNIFRDFFRKLLTERRRGGHTARLFFDGTSADADNSKSISALEALALSTALSMDSLVTGVSAGLGKMNLPILCAGAFLAGIGAISAGWKLGKKTVSTAKINLGGLCGAILILLAFVK